MRSRHRPQSVRNTLVAKSQGVASIPSNYQLLIINYPLITIYYPLKQIQTSKIYSSKTQCY